MELIVKTEKLEVKIIDNICFINVCASAGHIYTEELRQVVNRLYLLLNEKS